MRVTNPEEKKSIIGTIWQAHDVLSGCLWKKEMDDDLREDIAQIMVDLRLLTDRVTLFGLLSAAVGDVSVQTIDDIYGIEKVYDLPYDDDDEIDTEKVYNDIDGLVEDIKEALENEIDIAEDV